MSTVRRAAPIFPVSDLAIALAFYERLGFATRSYDDLHTYGFAERDGVEIHLGLAGGNQTRDGKHSAYLFVDDADALAREWPSAGIDLNLPVDTEWGKHEGAVVDPDGNVLRFGS